MIRYTIYMTRQLLRTEEEAIPQNTQSPLRLKMGGATAVLRPGAAEKAIMYGGVFQAGGGQRKEMSRLVQICPNCKSGVTQNDCRCPRCGRKIEPLYSKLP